MSTRPRPVGGRPVRPGSGPGSPCRGGSSAWPELRRRDAGGTQGGRRDRAARPGDAERTRRRDPAPRTRHRPAGRLPLASAAESRDWSPAAVVGAQAAYAVFTSGTTGEPKGVLGTHDAVLAYGDDHIRRAPAACRREAGTPAAHRPRLVVHVRRRVAAVGRAARRSRHPHRRRRRPTRCRSAGRCDRAPPYRHDRHDTVDVRQLKAFGLLSRTPLAVLALGGEAVGTDTWRSIRDDCARSGWRPTTATAPPRPPSRPSSAPSPNISSR